MDVNQLPKTKTKITSRLSVASDWCFSGDMEAIVIPCANKVVAVKRLRSEGDYWAELATRLGCFEARFRYPASPQLKRKGIAFEHMPIQATRKPEVVSLAEDFREFRNAGLTTFHALDLPLTRAMLSALSTIAENPGERWVLMKIRPDLNKQIQIAMTESCQALVAGATVKQALGRDRLSYMHKPDWDDLNRRIAQQLEPGNEQSIIEVSWRGFDPVSGSNWRLFPYSYQIVEVAGGYIYQLGHSLDLPVSIEVPAGVV